MGKQRKKMETGEEGKIPKRKRQGLADTPTKEPATKTCLPCIDGKDRNHGNIQSGSVL